ncbi:tetratricopeptide repeat protein [Candidatus Shapirobacteria bacterium]|nr:tetratricopeptide repeat protein [Candidatus Shapirobacteria bacterium]
MSKSEYVLNYLARVVIYIFVFLLPLFFLPIFSDYVVFPKMLLLFAFTFLLLILWLAKNILSHRVELKLTALDLPVLLLAISYVLSAIFQSPNKVEAFLNPLGPGIIILLTLLYFLVVNSAIYNLQFTIYNSLAASASVLSLISLFWFLEFWKVWGINLPDWLAQKTFTPTGGLLPQALFLAVALALIVPRLLASLKQKVFSLFAICYLLFAIVISLGLFISCYQLLATAKPLLLSFSAAWAIAIEGFKNWRISLLGVGPGNYFTAFNVFKPFSLNASPLWGIRFGASANWYLQLLSEVGIIGLGAYLFLIWRVVKARSKLPSGYMATLLSCYIATLLIFALQLFLPPNFLLIVTCYLLLVIIASSLPRKEVVEGGRILPWLITVISLVLILGSGFFVYKAALAEFYLNKSFVAAAANDGTQTYNYQRNAIENNPYIDRYRVAYSQTNLALANAIAGSPPEGKLTDQNRADITTLVQQSIAAAKSAIALNPTKITNWENLASIYRQLINFADGAANFAIGAYQQAINLDPANPLLRIDLGGLYYSQGNWDEAVRSFEGAVALKRDLANAHYNLSAALKEKKDWVRAAQEMEATLNLVPADSGDYQKAKGELEALQKKLTEEAKEATRTAQPAKPAGPETLTEPLVAPSPKIAPPISLPTESPPQP